VPEGRDRRRVHAGHPRHRQGRRDRHVHAGADRRRGQRPDAADQRRRPGGRADWIDTNALGRNAAGQIVGAFNSELSETTQTQELANTGGDAIPKAISAAIGTIRGNGYNPTGAILAWDAEQAFRDARMTVETATPLFQPFGGVRSPRQHLRAAAAVHDEPADVRRCGGAGRVVGVVGDFSQAVLAIRQDLTVDFSNQATVDVSGTLHHLWQQNKVARVGDARRLRRARPEQGVRGDHQRCLVSFLYGRCACAARPRARRVQDAARRHRRQHRRGHRPADLPVLQSYIPLALNGNYAFQMAAWGSDGYFNWLDTTQAKRQRRMALLTDCTDIYCAQGVNDIGTTLGSPDLPTMQNLRAIPVWNTFFNRGKRVWAHTITPRVTSTTGYGTLGAQTTTGNDPSASRSTTGCATAPRCSTVPRRRPARTRRAPSAIGSPLHPLAGYLEVADTVESSRDSGKWAIPSNLRTGTASISSASSTFTAWSGADLTSADLGRKIFIQGAGAAGAVYGGTINNVASATSATVSGGSAGTTVSGAVMHLGAATDDGLHPTQDGHLLMTPALRPPQATAWASASPRACSPAASATPSPVTPRTLRR
jgi:hypothetical protein